MALTDKQLFWKKHLEAAEQFSGPLIDYARLHKLDAKKLYTFKGVLREKAQAETKPVAAKSFVRVLAQQQVPVENDRVEVVLVNGVKLSLPNAAGLLEHLARL